MLDLTRLISRVGRGALTGVDRVEMAYLMRLARDDTPLWGIVHTAQFDYVFDPNGMAKLCDKITGKTPWGAMDLRALLRFKQSAAQKSVQSDLRRLAHKYVPIGQYSSLFSEVPKGIRYFNVGHSHLDANLFAVLHDECDAHISVLVHDVIPLTHPQFQRAGSVEKFEAKMLAVSRGADRVIYNSADSQAQAVNWMAKQGRVVPSVVAHLGVTVAAPSSVQIRGLDQNRPYFVVIGTIEPRKNHALLLDIWADMPLEDRPQLVIIGARGWNNAAIFAQLDRQIDDVLEVGTLRDGEIAQLLQGAAGLLFPSLVEGFGLPPAEAALLGTPVVCNDLPVYREFLGDYPIYAEVNDRYLWLKTITMLSDQAKTGDKPRQAAGNLPNWNEHFNLVLNLA